jgi:hypothetical protein
MFGIHDFTGRDPTASPAALLWLGVSPYDLRDVGRVVIERQAWNSEVVGDRRRRGRQTEPRRRPTECRPSIDR